MFKVSLHILLAVGLIAFSVAAQSSAFAHFGGPSEHAAHIQAEHCDGGECDQETKKMPCCVNTGVCGSSTTNLQEPADFSLAVFVQLALLPWQEENPVFGQVLSLDPPPPRN